jgi:hypothetical protein
MDSFLPSTLFFHPTMRGSLRIAERHLTRGIWDIVPVILIDFRQLHLLQFVVNPPWRKEGHVWAVETERKEERLILCSETLLLAKNGTVPRKSYLGFDLAGIHPERIADAELTLHFSLTGWGLASLVPDSIFSVYGLLDDQPWDEQLLDEGNAPANTGRNRGVLLDSEVRKLGSFLIEQGVQRGQFGIQCESLAAFLREHAGSTVTLIVVRDTRETEINGFVHGFASRRYPTLTAPTLAIRLAKL